MPIYKILLSLTLAVLFATNCVAQDDSRKAKKAVERAAASITKQMMKAFEAANLTDEQKEKASDIVQKHVPAVMSARKAQDSIVTKEQKKKRGEATKKAREDGVKGKEVAAAALKAMGLTDEEAKKFTEAGKKIGEANNKIKEAITALLTDEQKAAMPKPKGKKGKGKGKGKKKKDKDGDSDGDDGDN